RRPFQPSREFLMYDKPECFDITCKEAKRAFEGGHWDDAAALYRAAKNCADADQADRQAANLRIEACKTASQNELRRKEQEAVRQARHALAANRANDATQLLRAFDRSLAYRLADFANEYIAPEDNDACRQAMFDALYYAPSVHSGMADDRLSIPFCYQLGDNLDRELQVHYLGVSGNRKISAFARSRHLLFQWDAETFEPEEPLGLEDTTLLYCDAAPDNRTLLFLSRNVYLFWRSPRETFRLPVQNVSQYCFDEKGYNFYYLNPTEMQIFTLPLRDVFAQRKGGSRATPQPTGLQLGDGILLRLVSAKGRLWAGYRDSIVVFAPGAERGSWQREQVLLIPNPVRNYYTGELPYLLLKPAAGAALFFNDSAAHYFKLPVAAGYHTLEQHTVLAGFPIAVSQDARLAATYFIGTASDKDSRLYLYDTESGALRYAALIPASHSDMHLKTGVFSPDNRQFATTTGGGRLEVWTLDEGTNQRITPLGRNAFFALNADGTKLFAWRNDSLVLMPAGNAGQILETAPAPAGAEPGLVAGLDWLAYRTGFDSLVLTDRLGRYRHQIASPPGYNGEVAATFNTAESKMASLAGSDSIAVWSLQDGRLLAVRPFGGAIHQLHFIPQTDEIMVVQQVEADDAANEQTVIKIWNPAHDPDAKLNTVRLHDYATREVAFSPAGGLMAFTDGLDIRIFHRNDLLNETVRIRQYGLRMVTALAF
ncbi:MAG: WD40 repeat domain-containing protein, partial [Thermoanaerobaculia bacterium]|nr:WD40 repeat domain-containing protein [Thermoanaerobaculia bacterium]